MPSRREALIGGGAAGASLCLPSVSRASDRRALFLAEVRRATAAAGVPGVGIAMVEDGRLTLAEGFGVRSVEEKQPVDADTLFRVGSVAKPFTALTLLRLVEAGRVDLDAPVQKYLPNFRADPRITSRHLLSMSSGFADLTEPRPGLEDRAAASFAAELTTLSWEPGKWWSYCNPGFATAGAVIEAAGDHNFEVQAQAMLAALGMERSTFDIDLMATRPHTLPHEIVDGRARVIRPDALTDIRHDAGAGLMFSTARELGSFAEWLLSGPAAGGVISPATFKAMKRPALGIAPLAHGYGLGLTTQRIRGEPVVGHAGNIWGHSSLVFVAPERGFGLALMINVQGLSLVSSLLDKALEQVGGLAPVLPEPAVRQGDHLGFYETRQPITGERIRPEVVAVGDGIAVRRRDGSVGPPAMPFRPDIYKAADGAWVVFLRDSSGQVVGRNSGSRHAVKVA